MTSTAPPALVMTSNTLRDDVVLLWSWNEVHPSSEAEPLEPSALLHTPAAAIYGPAPCDDPDRRVRQWIHGMLAWLLDLAFSRARVDSLDIQAPHALRVLSSVTVAW